MEGRAKTSVILKDFLKSNPQNDMRGMVYNPVTNSWEKARSTLEKRMPNPMSKAWYTLPDFLDDEMVRFFLFQRGGGER